MVYASVEGLKGYDFSVSNLNENDCLSFVIHNFRFQVCRIQISNKIPYEIKNNRFLQYGKDNSLNQIDIPSFKLIARGNSIDEKEFNVITHSAADSLKARDDPLSNGIIKRIKKEIGGEWIVFAYVEGLKGYDFSK